MKKLLFIVLFGLCLMPQAVDAALPNSATIYANAAVTATPVQATTGVAILVGYNLSNTNTATVYVQFFDAATIGAVTLGTTPPKFWLAIPAGGGVTDGLQTFGPGFGLGCVIAVTTTPTGNTAPANAVPSVLFFN